MLPSAASCGAHGERKRLGEVDVWTQGCAIDFGVRARLSLGGTLPHIPSRLLKLLHPGVMEIRNCFRVEPQNPTGPEGGGLRGTWWQRSLGTEGRRTGPQK